MSDFEPNKLVEECMQNEDIMGLKGALIGIIFSNRSLANGEFNNTLKLIANSGINIYEKYDGEDIICNIIKGRCFTEDDFEEAVSNLKVNFCQERINDVKKISKELYANRSTEVNKKESTLIVAKEGENPIKKQICHLGKVNQKEENSSMKIVVGVAVVAAIAAAVGLVIKVMK